MRLLAFEIYLMRKCHKSGVLDILLYYKRANYKLTISSRIFVTKCMFLALVHKYRSEEETSYLNPIYVTIA